MVNAESGVIARSECKSSKYVLHPVRATMWWERRLRGSKSMCARDAKRRHVKDEWSPFTGSRKAPFASG